MKQFYLLVILVGSTSGKVVVYDENIRATNEITKDDPTLNITAFVVPTETVPGNTQGNVVDDAASNTNIKPSKDPHKETDEDFLITVQLDKGDNFGSSTATPAKHPLENTVDLDAILNINVAGLNKLITSTNKPPKDPLENALDVDFLNIISDYDDTISSNEEEAKVDNGTALHLTPLIKEGLLTEARNACKVDSDLFLGYESYSGFLTVDEDLRSHLFFWYFPVPGKPVNETPWLLWLQGGPGASSMEGLFDEIGPFTVSEFGSLKKNRNSWIQNHSLLFIDNPVGTGYSFTESSNGYAKDLETYATHLHTAMKQFIQLFPELQSAPLFLAGESYAGKYVPALAHKIHRHRETPPYFNLKVRMHTAMEQLSQIFAELQTAPFFVANESYDGKYVPALVPKIHRHRETPPYFNLKGRIHTAMEQLSQIFAELQTAPFFVASESYAGKYVPALAHQIHRHQETPPYFNLKVRMHIAMEQLSQIFAELQTAPFFVANESYDGKYVPALVPKIHRHRETPPYFNLKGRIHTAMEQLSQIFAELQTAPFFVANESYDGKYVPALVPKIHRHRVTPPYFNLKGRIHTAMEQLSQIFAELQTAPFFVASESYAGKYVPALAHQIHRYRETPSHFNQGVMLGNAMVDPAEIAHIADSFQYFGLIDHTQSDLIKPLVDGFQDDIAHNRSTSAKSKWVSLISALLLMSHQKHAYNFLRDNMVVGKYTGLLDKSDVKRALHVGDIVFSRVNVTVNIELAPEFLSSTKWMMEELLDHYRVLMYCGQLDQMLPCLQTSEFYRTWRWNRTDEFLQAVRYPYIFNGRLAGYHKSGGGLTEVMFRGAGHMVPADAPAPAQALVARFTHARPLSQRSPYYERTLLGMRRYLRNETHTNVTIAKDSAFVYL